MCVHKMQIAHRAVNHEDASFKAIIIWMLRHEVGAPIRSSNECTNRKGVISKSNKITRCVDSVSINKEEDVLKMEQRLKRRLEGFFFPPMNLKSSHSMWCFSNCVW